MKIARLINKEIVICPETGDTKAQVLAKAAEYGGTAHVYEVNYGGFVTLEQVVITGI
jgi:hypothetical protein